MWTGFLMITFGLLRFKGRRTTDAVAVGLPLVESSWVVVAAVAFPPVGGTGAPTILFLTAVLTVGDLVLT